MKEKLKTKLRRNMRIRTLSLLTVMSAVSLSAIAAAPTVSTEAKKAADMINADAPMQKMLAELTSPQGQNSYAGIISGILLIDIGMQCIQLSNHYFMLQNTGCTVIKPGNSPG